MPSRDSLADGPVDTDNRPKAIQEFQPPQLTIPRKHLAARQRAICLTNGANQAPFVNQRGWAMRTLVQIIRCERGANAIEYALVASLIAIAAFAAFENLGNRVDAMYNNVSNHL